MSETRCEAPIGEAQALSDPLRLRVDRLPAVNTSRHAHWWVLHRERQLWAVLLRAAIGSRRDPEWPWLNVAIECARHSSRRPDAENLAQSFKLTVDLLQPASQRNPGGLGIILNDGPKYCTRGYAWQYAPPGAGSIEIRVEPTPRAENSA